MRDIFLSDFSQDFFQRAFRLYFQELGVHVENWDELFQSMAAEQNNHAFILLDEGEDIVGFIQFTTDQLSNWFFEEKFGFIREFWVSPSFRRNGYGSRLLERTEAYFREQGIHKVILTTDTAAPFYQAHGYRQDTAYTAKNEDTVFTKNL